MNRRVVNGVVAGMLSAATALALPVSAEEAKTPVGAALILNMMSQPRESRDAAFDQSLREDGPSRARTTAEALLSRVVITVKNPCPPGTAHYEPPPLPGRRR